MKGEKGQVRNCILTIRWEEVAQDSIPWGVIIAIVLYIVIVCFTIMDAKRKCVESLVWNPDKSDSENLKCFEFGNEEEFDQRLLIKSDQNLYNITVYDAILLDNCAKIKKDKKSKDLLKSILIPKECIIFHIKPVEYVPHQIIEFENEAYMRCTIEVYSNGRVGDITLTGTYKLTFKALIYFMLLGIAKYRG